MPVSQLRADSREGHQGAGLRSSVSFCEGRIKGHWSSEQGFGLIHIVPRCAGDIDGCNRGGACLKYLHGSISRKERPLWDS